MVWLVCAKPGLPAYRPFCSRRCADVDLGRWLTGAHVIPGPPAEEDDTPQSSLGPDDR